jgi:hypothetical protein
MTALTSEWQKPSFCASGECPELMLDGDYVLLRSSLNPETVIRVPREQYRAMRKAIAEGEFDDF